MSGKGFLFGWVFLKELVIVWWRVSLTRFVALTWYALITVRTPDALLQTSSSCYLYTLQVLHGMVEVLLQVLWHLMQISHDWNISPPLPQLMNHHILSRDIKVLIIVYSMTFTPLWSPCVSNIITTVYLHVSKLRQIVFKISQIKGK